LSRTKARKPAEIAENLPVARVVLDLPAAHLDQEYDYLVPAKWGAEAQPGTRIKARFGGQDVSGFIVERLEDTDHDGELQPLRRLVSPERVLTPQVYALAKTVAENWAGSTADVLRLAIPPRHARAETAQLPDAPGRLSSDAVGSASVETPRVGSGSIADFDQLNRPMGDSPGRLSSDAVGSVSVETPRVGLPRSWTKSWGNYAGGGAFLAALCAGQAPRAVWTPLPGLAAAEDGEPPTIPHWAAAIAMAARAAVAAGRGALVVTPDAADVEQVRAALQAAGVAGVVVLEAEAGPERRYRSFLAALRGQARVVVGTRAAVYAPVAGLGLIVVWGDGEESLEEPRAPYANARDVAVLRAELENAALLVGSLGRTAAAQSLVTVGGFAELRPDRAILRARAPRMRVLTRAELAREGPVASTRLPSAAWQAVKDGLARGPVLIQVPRTGYIPVLACADCATRAACPECGGPLRLSEANRTGGFDGRGHNAAAAQPTSSLPTNTARPTSSLPTNKAQPTSSLPTNKAHPTSSLPTNTVQPASSLPANTAQPTSSVAASVERSSWSVEQGRNHQLDVPAPDCRWCGRLVPQWRCRECGGTQLRAVQIGAERTASELGRAFPGVPVVLSTAQAPGGVKTSIAAKPALVIATPGAEPIATAGYATVLLLDATQASSSLALGAPAEALRRWLAAAALTVPATFGGQVLLVGDVPTALANAFVAFDPVQFAERDLAERAELQLPPFMRVAALTGDRAAIDAVLDRVPLATVENRIGPVELDEFGEVGSAEPPSDSDGLFSAQQVMPPQVRLSVRVPAADGLELARQLRAAMRIRSARREAGSVRLQLDPADVI